MKDATAPLLAGIVETDETRVGGKLRDMRKADRERRGITGGSGNRDHMTMVLGAVQRGGDIRLKVGKRADSRTLRAFLAAVVDDGAEAIMTDE